MARHKGELRRKLRRYQQSGDGNWRFKALMLSAFEDEEAVGEVWPETDRYLSNQHKRSPYRAMHNPDEGIRNVVVPEQREGKELAHAREEFNQREMGEPIARDKYIKRMLLRGSTEELDTLWREELLTTVIEGAQVKEIARDAATVIDVDSKKGDYPRGEGSGYANALSEGGRIDDDMENYDTVAFDCTKYGQGFSVTEEMVDHAQIDAIERQVRFSGKAIENALNRDYINEVVDNAGNDVDTDQATPTLSEVQGINHAVGEIEKDDFPTPDITVMHPDYKTAYFDEANIAQAQQAGDDEVLRQRSFDPIFGTEVLTASAGVYNAGTYNWEWDSDGDRGAVVTNSDHIGIFMYEDISTKDFEDPIRDTLRGNARAWWDVKVLQPDAHCRLQY